MEWKSYFFFLLSGFSSVRSRLVSPASPDPPEPAVNRSVAGCAHHFPAFLDSLLRGLCGPHVTAMLSLSCLRRKRDRTETLTRAQPATEAHIVPINKNSFLAIPSGNSTSTHAPTYMHIHSHMHTQKTHIYAHTCIYTHAHACAHARVCTYIYTCVNVRIHSAHRDTHTQNPHVRAHMHARINMCMHIHTCIRTCMYMHRNTQHTYPHTHAHKDTPKTTYIHTCTHVHRDTKKNIHTHIHIYACTHIQTQPHTCVHIHTYTGIYTHMHALTHTCTQT